MVVDIPITRVSTDHLNRRFPFPFDEHLQARDTHNETYFSDVVKRCYTYKLILLDTSEKYNVYLCIHTCTLKYPSKKCAPINHSMGDYFSQWFPPPVVLHWPSNHSVAVCACFLFFVVFMATAGIFFACNSFATI